MSAATATDIQPEDKPDLRRCLDWVIRVSQRIDLDRARRWMNRGINDWPATEIPKIGCENTLPPFGDTSANLPIGILADRGWLSQRDGKRFRGPVVADCTERDDP